MLTKTRFKTICGSVIFGYLAALATPAMAANDAMLELIDIMVKKGTLTAEEGELLKGAAKADDETNNEGKAEIANAAKTLPKVTTNGKLEIASPDGKFKYGIGGRLMVDYAQYSDDEFDDGVTKTDLGSGQEIRRARLHANGTMYSNWDWKVEFDFAENAVAFKENMLMYKGFDPFFIKIGNQKTIGLETNTSSRFVTFIERAMLNEAFIPEERIGIQGFYISPSQHWTAAAAAIVGDDINSDGDADNEGFGATGRLTWAPFNEPGKILHFGVDGLYKHADETDGGTGANEFRFRSRPESHPTDIRLIDTGLIATGEDQTLYGFEAAGVHGPFSLQGEYFHTSVDRSESEAPVGVPRPDVDFDGWYVYGSWFITGESRAYNTKTAKFDRVTPKTIVGQGGWGAWELGMRYSALDLNDSTVIGGTERGITGGEEDNLTVGLNWYATPNIRFMANYTQVLELEDTNGSGAPDLTRSGAEPSAFTVRAQYDF